MLRVIIPVALLTIVLFAPVPYFQKEDLACKPGQTDCPKKGWHVSNSVLQTILGLISQSGRSANTPPPAATPSAAINTAESTASAATASWMTYTNTAYGYSIKYPPTFSSQMLAAGAGVKEATATAENVFLYRTEVTQPYEERYINLEVFQAKPPYNQGTVTKTVQDRLPVDKIIIPNAKFDIYSIPVTKAFLEINVSNNPDKKELANLILSTLKVLIPPSPSPVASASATPAAQISDMDKLKSVATDYLALKGYDRTKLKILAVTPLGKTTDKYNVSYIPSVDHVGGGLYILIGVVNGEWVIPDYRSTLYCEWVNSSITDENTIAFMGCGK
jgi:hypothetical protein